MHVLHLYIIQNLKDSVKKNEKHDVQFQTNRGQIHNFQNNTGFYFAPKKLMLLQLMQKFQHNCYFFLSEFIQSWTIAKSTQSHLINFMYNQHRGRKSFHPMDLWGNTLWFTLQSILYKYDFWHILHFLFFCPEDILGNVLVFEIRCQLTDQNSPRYVSLHHGNQHRLNWPCQRVLKLWKMVTFFLT